MSLPLENVGYVARNRILNKEMSDNKNAMQSTSLIPHIQTTQVRNASHKCGHTHANTHIPFHSNFDCAVVTRIDGGLVHKLKHT